MTENVNRLTERVAKMNDDNSVVKPKFNVGDVVVALESIPNLLTQGKEYIVGNVFYDCRFKLKEEIVVSKVETKQYLELLTGLVYDLVFEGDRVNVLKAVLSGSEVVVNIDNLKAPHLFVPYTKQMQKQQKKNEDLGVLANVTDEIRKFLDDNYVICHANVNRDTKGLVEVIVMLGESV